MSKKKFAKLDCEANGNPQPSYRWYYINIEAKLENVTGSISNLRRTVIDPTKDPKGRCSISAGSLIIHDPDSLTDSQMFQCEAYNVYGSVLSRTARIIFGQLETAPKQPRNERKVLSHQSETLPCEPPAHSPPDSNFVLFILIFNK